jgi:hypothetical protein
MEDITELYKIIVHTGAWTTALATLPPTYVDSNLPERGTPILKTLHHLNRADPLEDVLPLTTVLDALKPFVHENVHIETLQVLRSKMPGG